MKTKQISLGVLLKKYGACNEARVWVKGKTARQAYKTCERGDWLLWIFGRMSGVKGWPTRQQVVLACCDCAELSLKYIADAENRKNCEACLETTRKWAAGSATLDEVQRARLKIKYAAYAAYAYAADAAAAYAADAADADAAYAAYASAAAAADAAYAAYAADAAAADAAAARASMLNECAALVRKKLKMPRGVK